MYLMSGWARMWLETVSTFWLMPAPPMKTMQQYELDLVDEAARDFRQALDEYEAKYGQKK